MNKIIIKHNNIIERFFIFNRVQGPMSKSVENAGCNDIFK